jgi:phosphoribosylformylglycinamidine synthase subunit PurS
MPDSLRVRVLVRPKAGILDPQGEAVRSALPALGFEGVRTVHIGRLIEMEVDSTGEVDAMCRRLLSNPTIEEYEWQVLS